MPARGHARQHSTTRQRTQHHTPSHPPATAANDEDLSQHNAVLRHLHFERLARRRAAGASVTPIEGVRRMSVTASASASASAPSPPAPSPRPQVPGTAPWTGTGGAWAPAHRNSQSFGQQTSAPVAVGLSPGPRFGGCFSTLVASAPSRSALPAGMEMSRHSADDMDLHDADAMDFSELGGAGDMEDESMND